MIARSLLRSYSKYYKRCNYRQVAPTELLEIAPLKVTSYNFSETVFACINNIK